MGRDEIRIIGRWPYGLYITIGIALLFLLFGFLASLNIAVLLLYVLFIFFFLYASVSPEASRFVLEKDQLIIKYFFVGEIIVDLEVHKFADCLLSAVYIHKNAKKFYNGNKDTLVFLDLESNQRVEVNMNSNCRDTLRLIEYLSARAQRASNR